MTGWTDSAGDTVAMADELSALYVSVVPSFAGAGAAVAKGGKEAATGFTQAFASDFHPFGAVEPKLREGVDAFGRTGKESVGKFSESFDALPDALKKHSDKAATAFSDTFSTKLTESTASALPEWAANSSAVWLTG